MFLNNMQHQKPVGPGQRANCAGLRKKAANKSAEQMEFDPKQVVELEDKVTGVVA